MDEAAARRIAIKHALINAYRHDGKADTGVVIGKVIGELPDLRSQRTEIIPLIKAVTADINSLSFEDQVARLGAEYPEAIEQFKQAVSLDPGY
ncbi:MAG: glutamate--tRNA ligase, partial [Nitrososphaerales archaeon]